MQPVCFWRVDFSQMFLFCARYPRICSRAAAHPPPHSHPSSDPIRLPLAGVPSEVVSWMSDVWMVLRRRRAYCRRSRMWLIRTGLASCRLPGPYILLIQKATEARRWRKHWATTENAPAGNVVKYGRWHRFRWFPAHYRQHFYDADKQFIGPPRCR